MIEFKNVSKIYDKKPALQHMSLTIKSGEFFVIVGTSGSGKTTILRMLAGLENPNSGDIVIDGKRSMTFRLPSGASASCSKTTPCSAI